MCQQGAQQRAMPHDVQTPMICDHSFRNKSLRARNKVANVELLRGICCDCDLKKPTTQEKKRFFCLPKKKSKAKNQKKLMTTFGKSLFLIKCKKQKIFSVLRKKRAKLKLQKKTATFGTSLFLNKYRIRYAIYMPPNTKDLPTNQTMVAYGNRQNATAFARANNFDLLRSLKHLEETRLQNMFRPVPTCCE